MQAKTIGKIPLLVVGGKALYTLAKWSTDWMVRKYDNSKYKDNIEKYVPDWLINCIADTIPILVVTFVAEKFGIFDDLGLKRAGSAVTKDEMDWAIGDATRDMATRTGVSQAIDKVVTQLEKQINGVLETNKNGLSSIGEQVKKIKEVSEASKEGLQALGKKITIATEDIITSQALDAKKFVNEEAMNQVITTATEGMATKTYVEHLISEKLQPVKEVLGKLNNGPETLAGRVKGVFTHLGTFLESNMGEDKSLALPGGMKEVMDETLLNGVAKIAEDGVLG